jgi:hypothetical protein
MSNLELSIIQMPNVAALTLQWPESESSSSPLAQKLL